MCAPATTNASLPFRKTRRRTSTLLIVEFEPLATYTRTTVRLAITCGTLLASFWIGLVDLDARAAQVARGSAITGNWAPAPGTAPPGPRAA